MPPAAACTRAPQVLANRVSSPVVSAAARLWPQLVHRGMKAAAHWREQLRGTSCPGPQGATRLQQVAVTEVNAWSLQPPGRVVWASAAAASTQTRPSARAIVISWGLALSYKYAHTALGGTARAGAAT